MRNRFIPPRGAPRCIPDPPLPGPTRRELRMPVAMEGWVQMEEERHGIAILDLSRNGFGARAQILLPIGAEVSVWLPHYGQVRAQVRWALCGFFGGRFLDDLPAPFGEHPATPGMKEMRDGQPA